MQIRSDFLLRLVATGTTIGGCWLAVERLALGKMELTDSGYAADATSRDVDTFATKIYLPSADRNGLYSVPPPTPTPIPGTSLSGHIKYRNCRMSETLKEIGAAEIARTSTYDFDEYGKIERIETSGGGDPASVSISRYRYSDNRMTYMGLDKDGNGADDYIVNVLYDSQERFASMSTDKNGDGKADAISRWTYESDGRSSSRNTDSNNDGRVDSVTKFEYDNLGRTMAERVDGDADEVHDDIYLYRWCRAVLCRRDSIDRNGNIRWVVYYTYMEDGLMHEELLDFGGDNVIDRTMIYRYNDNGDLASSRKYENDTLIQDIDRSYYGDGRLRKILDGVGISEYSYECENPWD